MLLLIFSDLRLCYVILYYAVLCYAILCYVMSYYTMLCYTMLCYVMLYYAVLCYTMLCYVMLYYAMLCRVIFTTHIAPSGLDLKPLDGSRPGPRLPDSPAPPCSQQDNKIKQEPKTPIAPKKTQVCASIK